MYNHNSSLFILSEFGHGLWIRTKKPGSTFHHSDWVTWDCIVAYVCSNQRHEALYDPQKCFLPIGRFVSVGSPELGGRGGCSSVSAGNARRCRLLYMNQTEFSTNPHLEY